MGNAEKRMAFHEIGKGKFALRMQDNFEKAQRMAFETGRPIAITAKIVVSPPKSKDDVFGSIKYSTSMAVPSYTSIEHPAEIGNDGLIVADGTDVADLLQETLEPALLGSIKDRKEVNGGK